MGILDLIFPKRCVSCKRFGEYVCKNCLSKIKKLRNTICPMCERASFDGKTHPGCRTRYSLDGSTVFYKYDGPVRAAIKRLKYKPYLSELVNTLVVSILDSIESKRGQFIHFVIVPVPLHPQRERERGFNQAALIGKELAQKLNIEFKDDILKRTRYTKPQVELKGEERRKNISDAFAIAPNILVSQYPNILLIDDVWTTGSTMRACGNVLKRAGAKKVWAMTLVR